MTKHNKGWQKHRAMSFPPARKYVKRLGAVTGVIPDLETRTCKREGCDNKFKVTADSGNEHCSRSCSEYSK